MKITKARLIVSIVLAVVLACAIAGGAVWFAVTQKPNSTASTNTTRLFTDNLLSSGTTIKGGNARKLVNAVGGESVEGEDAIVKNWAELKADNGGNPIIFKMGTIPGKSTELEWEVVYRNGDYITLWLTKNYTKEYFNYSGSSIKNSSLAGYTSGKYSNYGNYSQSVLRDVTKGIYTNLISTYPILDELVVSPSVAEQTYQETQANTYYYYTGQGYWSLTNGLKTNANSGSGIANANKYGWTWDSTAYEDKFWIPSFYEVFNKGNGADTGSNGGANYFDGGYWGFSAYSDLGFSTSCYDSSGSTSYCWLRSGRSYNSNFALLVDGSGGSNRDYVYGTSGVRPAAHLSLSTLASYAGYSVTASVAGGGQEHVSATISPAVDGGSIDKLGDEVVVNYTITDTAHYRITQITKDGEPLEVTNDKEMTFNLTIEGDTEYICTVEPYTYTLTTAVANSVGGSLKITSPISGSTTSTASYDIGYGYSVTLTATANTGYQFVKWQKDGTDAGTSTTYTFTMGEGHNVTAYFKILSYSITIQAGTGGSVSPSGTYSWEYNSKHTITATPSTHYTFKNWTNSSGTAVSTSASYTVTVGTSNQTYTANFTIKQYTLKISSNDTNTGSVMILEGTTLTDQTSLDTTANALTKYTAVAIANPNYLFYGWQNASGEIVSTTPRLDITLSGNGVYKAVFVNAVGGIFVTSTYGGMAYILGDNFEELEDTDLVVINTRIAVSGYRIVRWIDQDGNVLDDGNADLTSLVMTKAQLYNKLVTAVFEYQGSNIKDDTGN